MYTKAYERFIARSLRLTQLLNFVTRLSRDYDTVLAELSEYDLEGEVSEALIERVTSFALGRNATEQLDQHIELVWELILCRSVDDFLLYISDVIANVFRDRPETLKSARTVRIDRILDHATMEDLVVALADKRVAELAYLGMRDLAKELRDELAFDLFPASDDLSKAIKLIEIRNLFIHNGGVVNQHFLSRVHSIHALAGERIHLGEFDIADSLTFLADAASTVDIRAIEKFGLSTAARENPMSSA